MRQLDPEYKDKVVVAIACLLIGTVEAAMHEPYWDVLALVCAGFSGGILYSIWRDR